MNTSNTYYVLGYYLKDTEPLYITPDNFGDTAVSKAQRYGSVVTAAAVAAQKTWDKYLPGFAIVRVTETNSRSTVRLENRTQINAAKPVVLYSVRLKQYGAVNAESLFYGVQKITDATVFTDLADAVLALQKGLLKLNSLSGPIDPEEIDTIHFHQVTTEPTFSYTTEVLA